MPSLRRRDLRGLGCCLAMIGLLGAVSYSVGERKKELGIRVALGARPGQLLGMVLRQTAMVAGAGIVIGLLLGIGATVALRSQLYAHRRGRMDGPAAG